MSRTASRICSVVSRNATANCQPNFSRAESPFEFINTSFENASPLHWELDPDGVIQVYLVYDQERCSLNRANGHWHFKLQAKTGTKLTAHTVEIGTAAAAKAAH